VATQAPAVRFAERGTRIQYIRLIYFEQREATMNTEPQKEHKWLEKLVGEWTYESDFPPEPGKPPEKCTGTEVVRSLGGLWVLGEGRGEMPGGGALTMVLTLGYDPQKKRYVGTWIGTMMANLWVYEGAVDVTGNKLTLHTEGPDMAVEGKTAKYKDVIEFKSDDHRVLTSHTQGEDGRWNQIMTMSYRRKR